MQYKYIFQYNVFEYIGKYIILPAGEPVMVQVEFKVISFGEIIEANMVRRLTSIICFIIFLAVWFTIFSFIILFILFYFILFATQ